jgi:hypothetical protein
MAGMGQSAAACAGRHSRGFNVRSNGLIAARLAVPSWRCEGFTMTMPWAPRLISRQLIKKFCFLNEFTSGECDGRASLKSLKLM